MAYLCGCSRMKGAAVGTAERPRAVVQTERRMHAIKKIAASHAVNFLRTSAVEVPKRESDVSPPKEAPRPVLLLS